MIGTCIPLLCSIAKGKPELVLSSPSDIRALTSSTNFLLTVTFPVTASLPRIVIETGVRSRLDNSSTFLPMVWADFWSPSCKSELTQYATAKDEMDKSARDITKIFDFIQIAIFSPLLDFGPTEISRPSISGAFLDLNKFLMSNLRFIWNLNSVKGRRTKFSLRFTRWFNHGDWRLERDCESQNSFKLLFARKDQIGS